MTKDSDFAHVPEKAGNVSNFKFIRHFAAYTASEVDRNGGGVEFMSLVHVSE